MNLGFCIILSKYRLYQGIALYNTLIHHQKDAKIYILCVDNDSFSVFSKLRLRNCEFTHVSEIEDEQLLARKRERLLNEYCWTMKPVFIESVFHKHKELDYVTYLDADLCFFSSPDTIFNNQSENAILLTPHNFIDSESFITDQCGKYNSGFVSFKRDRISEECLKWWKEKCLEWCFDRAENGRYGDQKYLDELPLMFEEIDIVKTPGVNIAPWNHSRYMFSVNNSNVYVNENRLIIYHFCGFRIVNKHEFLLLLRCEPRYIPEIHKPYGLVVQEAIHIVERADPNFNGYSSAHYLKSLLPIYKI